MAHATPDDVAEYLMRELGDEEEQAALLYLNAIELIIRREVPDFDTRLAEDADFAAALTYIEAVLVMQILQNPNRYQYEQAGDYSYSLQRVLQTDSLRSSITDDMWWMLGVGKRAAFTIETAVWGRETRAPRWWTPVDKW